MTYISKTSIFISLAIMLFPHDSLALSYATHPGTILINLRDADKYVEFKLEDGQISKTTEGKVTQHEIDGRTYVDSWTELFKRQYYTYRIYRFKMEERLAVFLSPFDLVALQNINTSYYRSVLFENKNKYENETIYLGGPSRKTQYFIDYSYNFNPNRQFTYVIYHYVSGGLINVATKKVTFPFGIDDIKHPDWNSNGRLVAYSFQGHKSKYMLGDIPQVKIKDEDRATLVVVDVENEKTLLRKNIGKKYVADLAWSPDSSFICVITVRPRLGLWPWELLSAFSGHPVWHNSFALEIYDMKGNIIYEKELDGSYVSGGARIVWI